MKKQNKKKTTNDIFEENMLKIANFSKLISKKYGKVHRIPIEVMIFTSGIAVTIETFNEYLDMFFEEEI